MGECIVKAPKYSKYSDYDYIGFSFDGKHCCEDLGIIRTSSGDRYQESMPQLKDKTSHVDGEDYTRVERSFHAPRQFKIDFAFDGLTDVKLQGIRQAFMPGKEGGLWFDEAPYKVYDARVSDRVTLSYIPLDEEGGTIYKGTGTVNFVCDYPYAHTPDFVIDKDKLVKRDGKQTASYRDSGFKNVDQWKAASGLDEGVGEVPFYFEATIKDEEKEEDKNEEVTYKIEAEGYAACTLTFKYISDYDGYYCIKYCYEEGEYQLDLNTIGTEMPSEINEKTVIGITKDAFKNHSELAGFDKNGNDYLTVGTWVLRCGKYFKPDEDFFDYYPNLADYAFAENQHLNKLNLAPVTHIGSYCFSNARASITTNKYEDITLQLPDPSKLNYIGRAPFHACWDIEGFKWPDGTEDSETYAIINNCIIDKERSVLLQGCKGTVFPSKEEHNYNDDIYKSFNVKTIGEGSFRYVGYSKPLGDLLLPEGITTIETRAFQQTGFKKVIIPSSTQFISDCAFQQMNFLESVEIKNNSMLQEIGALAFTHNKDKDTDKPLSLLTQFTFETLPWLKIIKNDAFAYTLIKSLDFSNAPRLLTLERRAFASTGELTSIQLPQSLTYIGEQCFLHTKKLTDIIIPSNVTTIGASAFYDSGLANAIFENKEKWFVTINGSKTELSAEQLNATNLTQNYNAYIWINESKLTNLINHSVCSCSTDGTIQKEKIIKLLEQDVSDYDKITWNNATGLVIGEKDGVKKAIHFQGDSAGELPPGIVDTINIQDIQYHYWYY